MSIPRLCASCALCLCASCASASVPFVCYPLCRLSSQLRSLGPVEEPHSVYWLLSRSILGAVYVWSERCLSDPWQYTCDAWRSGGVACSVPRSDRLHEILSQDAQSYSGDPLLMTPCSRRLNAHIARGSSVGTVTVRESNS